MRRIFTEQISNNYQKQVKGPEMILWTAVDSLHVTPPVKLVMELQVHWKLCCVTLHHHSGFKNINQKELISSILFFNKKYVV